MVDINQLSRYKSPAKETLKKIAFDNACLDFHSIFLDGDKNVFFQALTLYCHNIIDTSAEADLHQGDLSDEDFRKRVTEREYRHFDRFADLFNDVSSQFGLDHCLTRAWLVPRQEEVTREHLWEPSHKLYIRFKIWRCTERFLQSPQVFSGRMIGRDLSLLLSQLYKHSCRYMSDER